MVSSAGCLHEPLTCNTLITTKEDTEVPDWVLLKVNMPRVPTGRHHRATDERPEADAKGLAPVVEGT